MKYYYKVFTTYNESTRVELEKMLSIGYHIMQSTPFSNDEDNHSGVEYVLYIEADKLQKD